MEDIITLERRIARALMRIGTGVEAVLTADAATRQQAMVVLQQAQEDAQLASVAQNDLVTALAELDGERKANAELRAAFEQASTTSAQTIETQAIELAEIKRLLDNQGLELQRMRKAAVALREELRSLREAQDMGQADAASINRALQVELDALRATHLSELAELAELSAALEGHLTEAESA